MDCIITYFPSLRKHARREIKDAGGVWRAELAAGIARVELDKALSDAVFVRHIFPVFAEGAVPLDKDAALKAAEDAVASFAAIKQAERFGVQCRVISGGGVFSAKDIEVRVGRYFDELGAVPVFSDYGLTDFGNVTVISLLFNESRFYAGVSKAHDNLSDSPNEYRVLSRGSGREISRAENKLKEALHKFKIRIGESGGRGKYALDIGASPGGWTKVLADMGLTVYAVDPGELSPKLANVPNIKHFRSRIEDLTFGEDFAVIVCDMNVDPQITAKIIDKLSNNVKSGTDLVITLKLPFSDVWRGIAEARAILENDYDVLAVKNLTYNRMEVTVHLRRK